MTRRTYVELFAGCGGLSLGLSSLGYERLLANELSPMAAETYAYNLLATDLTSTTFSKQDLLDRRVLWLGSKYPHGQVADRLQENPLEIPHDAPGDVQPDTDLTGKLLVGDIRRLNQLVETRGGSLVAEEPDLVSGGPPCQSFSLAGLREYGNNRNRLPWEFAKFVEAHHPRLAILENVSGILLPFQEEGRKIYAWFEVAKAFAAVGYAPICLHVNAVDVGVAQNRPRFLMFAVRADLVDLVANRLGPDASQLLGLGRELLAAQGEVDHDPHRHRVVDIRGDRILKRISSPHLRRVLADEQPPVPVRDAIDDLAAGLGSANRSRYADELSTLFVHAMESASPTENEHTANTEHRSHSPRVRSRFRIYQLLSQMEPSAKAGQISRVLRSKDSGTQETIPEDLAEALLSGHQPVLGLDGRPVTTALGVQALIASLKTQKHSQKALRAEVPAPAALSIPDDACHYRELRTLSVREMARIQSFPDEFVFRSNPTTGGPRRKFQVPQYTQVGNAVPPKLGRTIGRFADFLLGFDDGPTSEVSLAAPQLIPLPLG